MSAPAPAKPAAGAPPPPELRRTRRPTRLVPSYRFIKRCSYALSVVYVPLLLFAFGPLHDETWNAVFGWVHGFGWIGMTLLSLRAAQGRTITLGTAAVVSIGGTVAPFFGSALFAWRDRRNSGPPPR